MCSLAQRLDAEPLSGQACQFGESNKRRESKQANKKDRKKARKNEWMQRQERKKESNFGGAEEATGCGPLAALAARAASGELAALQAQPDALALCLPAFSNILSSTLRHVTAHAQPHPILYRPDSAPPPAKPHSAVVQHWCSVMRVLVDILNRHQILQHLVPLLEQPFTAQHSSPAAAICVALLHLMPMLFDRLGLDAYLTHFHPHMMHMIITSANQPKPAGSAALHSVTSSQVAATFERAQMTNAASTLLCGVVATKLALPVVLEHVIRPLLLALGNSPDVAVALIGVGGAMGGPMTALHVLPSLIMVLISSNVSAAVGKPAQRHLRPRRRTSEGDKYRAYMTRQVCCHSNPHFQAARPNPSKCTLSGCHMLNWNKMVWR